MGGAQVEQAASCCNGYEMCPLRLTTLYVVSRMVPLVGRATAGASGSSAATRQAAAAAPSQLHARRIAAARLLNGIPALPS